MTTRRFESISGILNRTNTDPEQAGLTHEYLPESPAEAPATPPANVTNLHPPIQDRLPSPGTPNVSAKSDGGVRRIAFRLDPNLHSALTTTAANAKTSHGQVVLDSIEIAHRSGGLTELVAKEAGGLPTDGLFPRLKGRGPAQPTVPVEIRLHVQAVAVLDSLVAQTKAESRTQLIVAALRQRLSCTE